MSDCKHRESSAGNDASVEQPSTVEEGPSAKLAGSFIKSAVLGLAFGAVLFMVADQTGVAAPLLRWLHLPGGEHFGAKQLVLVGVLLGVSLNALDKLVCQARRLFSNLDA
ncbi:MAG: hypothetical protein V5A20_13880 [Salinibacter sp.]|uniref:hypothetical protein n=1 Tax=Salinibacter sp. TaxID=2065818 RepID=UPI002FC2AFCC